MHTVTSDRARRRPRVDCVGELLESPHGTSPPQFGSQLTGELDTRAPGTAAATPAGVAPQKKQPGRRLTTHSLDAPLSRLGVSALGSGVDASPDSGSNSIAAQHALPPHGPTWRRDHDAAARATLRQSAPGGMAGIFSSGGGGSGGGGSSAESRLMRHLPGSANQDGQLASRSLDASSGSSAFAQQLVTMRASTPASVVAGLAYGAPPRDRRRSEARAFPLAADERFERMCC